MVSPEDFALCEFSCTSKIPVQEILRDGLDLIKKNAVNIKSLRRTLNKIKPHFSEGGRLEKLYPAYDAFETFLFVPNHTTSSNVMLGDSIDLKRTMGTIILALIPCLILMLQHWLSILLTV